MNTTSSFIDSVFQTKIIADLKVSRGSVISYFIVQPYRERKNDHFHFRCSLLLYIFLFIEAVTLEYCRSLNRMIFCDPVAPHWSRVITIVHPNLSCLLSYFHLWTPFFLFRKIQMLRISILYLAYDFPLISFKGLWNFIPFKLNCSVLLLSLHLLRNTELLTST